jgi:hypothetical protein
MLGSRPGDIDTIAELDNNRHTDERNILTVKMWDNSIWQPPLPVIWGCQI